MPKKGSRDNSLAKKKAELFKSEIDLGFTFAAVARASYSANSPDRSRQAALEAYKKFKMAEKQLETVELSRSEWQRQATRLKNLKEILVAMESKHPELFANQPSPASDGGR